jgi:hypothetical protein
VRAECSFEFHHPAIKTTQTNDRPTEEEMPPKKKTGTAHVSEEKSARFATRFYDAFFAPSRLKRKIVVIPRRFLDLNSSLGRRRSSRFRRASRKD